MQPGARFDGFPIGRLNSFLTPTGDFFVRDHFGVPELAARAPSEWRVAIKGDVARPRELCLEDLSKLSRIERPVTLECAGNAGRNGLGWPGGQRAWSGASTATFQGVSVAELIRIAGPLASVRELVFEGADEGAESEAQGRAVFARSVPIEVALSSDAILATGMNGAPLPLRHGGPLRVIFPGRYATDSVKWVRRIRALSEPFDGFYQTRRYVRSTPENPRGDGLGELRVQSEIARPRPGERLPSGLRTEILGVAWSNLGGLARVEVSTDGGATFEVAEFIDGEQPGCWRRWRRPWTPEKAGPRLLLSRAWDRRGAAQPLLSDEELGRGYSISGPDRIQYANNAVPVIPVTVL